MPYVFFSISIYNIRLLNIFLIILVMLHEITYRIHSCFFFTKCALFISIPKWIFTFHNSGQTWIIDYTILTTLVFQSITQISQPNWQRKRTIKQHGGELKLKTYVATFHEISRTTQREVIDDCSTRVVPPFADLTIWKTKLNNVVANWKLKAGFCQT